MRVAKNAAFFSIVGRATSIKWRKKNNTADHNSCNFKVPIIFTLSSPIYDLYFCF